ncbi:MAG TPA: NAD(P)H-quinone oxidoreductase [Beijerinckiaceae bacterium]|nr:NAD(P)H-quinone oxidoreductase [Beijerinckiaceae bacterium]
MPSLPETMTCIAIREPGPPNVLTPQTRPLPQPGAGEILIKVAAAGVNRPDVSQRQGRYPPPPGASDLPGLEVAGTVAALGPSATRFEIGDKVCSLVHGGGYAEYCTVHETIAQPIPGALSFVEAAAIPETFFTVWSNMFDRGKLQAGETLLVHGGSSGIGTTAIMLAKAFGASVIVTAGSAEKCAFCVKLGADHAIDYKQEDFVERVKAMTNGRGADVILDMVGGSYVERNYRAAAMDARIVQIAFQLGYKIELDLRPITAKRLVHTGSTLRPRPVAEKAAISQALADKVWPLIAAGRVKPVIDSTYPLRDAARAHERMESSGHIGKIVLAV